MFGVPQRLRGKHAGHPPAGGSGATPGAVSAAGAPRGAGPAAAAAAAEGAAEAGEDTPAAPPLAAEGLRPRRTGGGTARTMNTPMERAVVVTTTTTTTATMEAMEATGGVTRKRIMRTAAVAGTGIMMTTIRIARWTLTVLFW